MGPPHFASLSKRAAKRAAAGAAAAAAAAACAALDAQHGGDGGDATPGAAVIPHLHVEVCALALLTADPRASIRAYVADVRSAAASAAASSSSGAHADEAAALVVAAADEAAAAAFDAAPPEPSQNDAEQCVPLSLAALLRLGAPAAAGGPASPLDVIAVADALFFGGACFPFRPPPDPFASPAHEPTPNDAPRPIVRCSQAAAAEAALCLCAPVVLLGSRLVARGASLRVMPDELNAARRALDAAAAAGCAWRARAGAGAGAGGGAAVAGGCAPSGGWEAFAASAFSALDGAIASSRAASREAGDDLAWASARVADEAAEAAAEGTRAEDDQPAAEVGGAVERRKRAWHGDDGDGGEGGGDGDGDWEVRADGGCVVWFGTGGEVDAAACAAALARLQAAPLRELLLQQQPSPGGALLRAGRRTRRRSSGAGDHASSSQLAPTDAAARVSPAEAAAVIARRLLGVGPSVSRGARRGSPALRCAALHLACRAMLAQRYPPVTAPDANMQPAEMGHDSTPVHEAQAAPASAVADAAAEATAWRLSFARALVALIPQPAGGSGVAFAARAVTAEATAARRVAEGLVAAAASHG